MRDDMAKVVTERPRRGHGNTSKKTTGQRIKSYDPDREYDEPNRLLASPGRTDMTAKSSRICSTLSNGTCGHASDSPGTRSTVSCRANSIDGV